MRAVVQRVSKAAVSVNGEVVGSIGRGMLVLLGVSVNDDEKQAEKLADKIFNLRFFNDENRKMNLSCADVDAEILVISQFTLYGDCRKGRRPSYTDAAPPELAEISNCGMLNHVLATSLETNCDHLSVNCGLPYIKQMPPAAATRTDLNNAATPDYHWHHRSSTFSALCPADKFCMTVGAEDVNNGIRGNIVFGIDLVTSVETRQQQPAVFLTKGDSDPNRRVTIYHMMWIHQTVIAPGTTYLYWKDSLISFYFYHIETGTHTIKYFAYH